MVCLRFLPIDTKLAAPKLDVIATRISFSPDIVTLLPSCLKKSGLWVYGSGHITSQMSLTLSQVGPGPCGGI